MKWNWKLPSRAQWQSWLVKYKLVLLLVLAGVVLLAWPTGEREQDRDTQEASSVTGEESFSVEELEERLSQAISRIQGAGQCTVLLSLDQGVERVLWRPEKESPGVARYVASRQRDERLLPVADEDDE